MLHGWDETSLLGHSDSRTTLRYDMSRANLDRTPPIPSRSSLPGWPSIDHPRGRATTGTERQPRPTTTAASGADEQGCRTLWAGEAGRLSP